MKKLSRENFKRMHDIACGDWKEKLIDWYGNKFAVLDQIEIKDKEYSLMRSACTPEQNKLFDEIFGEEKDITDKIKSLNDAIKYLGESDKSVIKLRKLQEINTNVPFQSLVVIVKALNEGWYPNWKDTNERKFFIYFDMRNGKTSYFDWNCRNYDTNVPSRLMLKSSKLAEYCGKQFENIWDEYMK